MRIRVNYSERAIIQLEALYAYIAEDSDPYRADTFVGSIVDYCDSFDTFPFRGTQRDDILPGLRLVGFRRRVTIAFTVDTEIVLILGVFYGGQDIETAFQDNDV